MPNPMMPIPEDEPAVGHAPEVKTRMPVVCNACVMVAERCAFCDKMTRFELERCRDHRPGGWKERREQEISTPMVDRRKMYTHHCKRQRESKAEDLLWSKARESMYADIPGLREYVGGKAVKEPSLGGKLMLKIQQSFSWSRSNKHKGKAPKLINPTANPASPPAEYPTLKKCRSLSSLRAKQGSDGGSSEAPAVPRIPREYH